MDYGNVQDQTERGEMMVVIKGIRVRSRCPEVAGVLSDRSQGAGGESVTGLVLNDALVN